MLRKVKEMVKKSRKSQGMLSHALESQGNGQRVKESQRRLIVVRNRDQLGHEISRKERKVTEA